MAGHRILNIAALAGLAMAFAAAPRPAEAQIMDGLLGFIGVHEEKPEVDYRERAPLVVPPKNALPAPQESAASKNAAWPKDPDVQRRKAAAAAGRMPATETEEYKRQLNPHLPIDAVRSARKAGAGEAPTPGQVFGDNSREANWIHPDNMRALNSKAQQTAGTSSGAASCDGAQEAPTRRYLTEPPSALRKCVAGYKTRTTRGAVDEAVNENDTASPYAVLTKKPQNAD